MEKNDDANIECKENFRTDEDTAACGLKSVASAADSWGAAAGVEAMASGAEAEAAASGAEAMALGGTSAPEDTCVLPSHGALPATATEAALSIISTMMNEIRGVRASSTGDLLDCRPLLKTFRTHPQRNCSETFPNPEEVVGWCSNTNAAHNVTYCETVDSVESHSHKTNEETHANVPLALKTVNYDIITQGTVNAFVNTEVSHSHTISGTSEEVTIQLRYMGNNTAINGECKKEEGLVETSTEEEGASGGEREDRSRHETPLRPLRPLRQLRISLPPCDQVRPMLTSEIESDRYDFLWSNVGLLRRYRDPLRLTPSRSGLSDEDGAQATTSDLADDYCNFGDELSEGGVPVVKGGKLESSPTSQELGNEALDGKVSNTAVHRSTTGDTVWHTDSDAQNQVNSRKSIRKRVRFFFKSLFRISKHDKQKVKTLKC